MRSTPCNSLHLGILVRLWDRGPVYRSRIKISKLNGLVGPVWTRFYCAYRCLADVNLILSHLNQVVQKLLRMFPFVHVIFVEQCVHHYFLVLLLGIRSQRRRLSNLIKEPIKACILKFSLTFGCLWSLLEQKHRKPYLLGLKGNQLQFSQYFAGCLSVLASAI